MPKVKYFQKKNIKLINQNNFNTVRPEGFSYLILEDNPRGPKKPF